MQLVELFADGRKYLITLMIFCRLIQQITAQSIDWECDFVVRNGVAINNLNCCTSKNLVITNPTQSVREVNGRPQSFYVSQNVRMINVTQQTVNYFPTGLEYFFPNLECIFVLRSNLKVITKYNLQPFALLKRLELYENELISLECDLFAYNPELQFINFNTNQISAIGDRILESLDKVCNERF